MKAIVWKCEAAATRVFLLSLRPQSNVNWYPCLWMQLQNGWWHFSICASVILAFLTVSHNWKWIWKHNWTHAFWRYTLLEIFCRKTCFVLRPYLPTMYDDHAGMQRICWVPFSLSPTADLWWNSKGLRCVKQHDNPKWNLARHPYHRNTLPEDCWLRSGARVCVGFLSTQLKPFFFSNV